eukprot:3158017-Rhodomonas_salina.2
MQVAVIMLGVLLVGLRGPRAVEDAEESVGVDEAVQVLAHQVCAHVCHCKRRCQKESREQASANSNSDEGVRREGKEMTLTNAGVLPNQAHTR